jgi:hypothetical protein
VTTGFESHTIDGAVDSGALRIWAI